MVEAVQLGILPPDQTALKFWGFHGIYKNGDKDLFVLWKIYMLLIHTHHFQAELLAQWCSDSKLAHYAVPRLGSDTPEGQWLAQHGSVLHPPDTTEESSLDAIIEIWYPCALRSFDSAEIQQIGNIGTELLEKRKCYLAYGVLNFRGFPDPKYTRDDFNIWHNFDSSFGTREYSKQWSLFGKAIKANSNIVIYNLKEFSHFRFEVFWDQYISRTLVSWVESYADDPTV